MWKTEKLGNLVNFYTGGTPNKKVEAYWNGDIPWISAKTMKSERINTSDLFITEEGLAHGSKLAPQGSLLLLVRGSGLFNGIPICYVESPVAYNQDVKCIQSCSEIENEYIYYWLKANSSFLQKKLEMTGIGAGKFDTKFLAELDVSFPDKKTRGKIIKFANALTNKLFVNNAINWNLSEQALAYFLELFGSAEKDSTIEKLSLNVTDGVHNTVKDYSKGEYLLLSCKNIKGSSLSLGDSERRINKETFEKLRKRTKLAKGDILLSSVGTVGELLLLNFEPENFEFQRSVAIIKPNPNEVSSAYLYFALLAQKQEIVHAAHGAVQQCIFISDIKGFQVHRPEQNLLNQFNELVVPLLDIINMNEEENKHLVLIRDILLPNLMSGELDVSELNI